VNYARLLPINKDEKIPTFADRWLREITPTVTDAQDPEDAVKMREYIDKLSTLLPIFIVLIACYDQKIAKETREYLTTHPAPGKGETNQWKREIELFLADLTTMREMLESYHKAVSHRLSACQTNLRTKSEEYRSGL